MQQFGNPYGGYGAMNYMTQMRDPRAMQARPMPQPMPRPPQAGTPIPPGPLGAMSQPPQSQPAMQGQGMQPGMPQQPQAPQGGGYGAYAAPRPPQMLTAAQLGMGSIQQPQQARPQGQQPPKGGKPGY